MTDFIYNFSLKIFELMQGFFTFCWSLITSGALRFIADHFIGFTVFMCILCTCIDEFLYYKRTGKHNVLVLIILSLWKLIKTVFYKLMELFEEKGIELPFLEAFKEPKTIEPNKPENRNEEKNHTVVYKEANRQPAEISRHDNAVENMAAESISSRTEPADPYVLDGAKLPEGAHIVTNPQNIMIPKDGALERAGADPGTGESVVKDNA